MVAMGGQGVGVDGAMLAGPFGFFAAGAAASVNGFVSKRQVHQRSAAVGDAAFDVAQMAPFANGRAGLPIDGLPQKSHLPEPGCRPFHQ